MKRLSILAVLIFARVTLADSPEAKPPAESSEAKTAETLVQRQLLRPLAAKEEDRSSFSRARMPPRERRVHVDAQPRKDAKGSVFVRFTVDERHGLGGDDESKWSKAAITGCVYVDRSEVFVQKGDQFRPAAFLLGKNLKAAPEHTCEGEPTQVAGN